MFKSLELNRQLLENAEISEADAESVRLGAELWRAVIREGTSPADDTRMALQAVRASLDAARHLRAASSLPADEQRRCAVLSADAAEAWEQALRRWSAGRGVTSLLFSLTVIAILTVRATNTLA